MDNGITTQPIAAGEHGAPTPSAGTSQPPASLKSTDPDLGLSDFYCEAPNEYTNKTIDIYRVLQRPPLEWLYRTWTVTHSSLAMWRDARNVRITYTEMPETNGQQIGDLVEYEPTKSAKPKLKNVRGVDTVAESFKWRGSSWLFFVTSRWEILGWGEVLSADGKEVVERWVVTWFAATTFTKEGIDFYSDRKEGMSKETYERIVEGLNGLEKQASNKDEAEAEAVSEETKRQRTEEEKGVQATLKRLERLKVQHDSPLMKMLREDLKEVEIKLPWVES